MHRQPSVPFISQKAQKRLCLCCELHYWWTEDSPGIWFMISSPHRIHSCFQDTLGLCLAPENTLADQNIVSQNSCLWLFLSRNRKQLAQLSDTESHSNLQIVALGRCLGKRILGSEEGVCASRRKLLTINWKTSLKLNPFTEAFCCCLSVQKCKHPCAYREREKSHSSLGSSTTHSSALHSQF